MEWLIPERGFVWFWMIVALNWCISIWMERRKIRRERESEGHIRTRRIKTRFTKEN